MRKGISPLVAAVLLIAATMSIAGVLAYWASSTFVKTAPAESNSLQNTCQSADFQIYQCLYSNTTKSLSFVLYNTRTVTLTGLSATVFGVHNDIESWGNIALSGSLSSGQFIGYSLTSIPSNFTKLVVTTSLCPSLIHDTTCTRG
jgi:flagellin-like protein